MQHSPSIAEEFARQGSLLRSRAIPDPALSYAKRLLLDFCGNVLGGSSTDSFRLAAAALSHVPDGPYTVVGHRGLALPEYAALLNGIAAHSLEADDIQNRSSIHMGAVVLPVVLATSELVPVSGLNAMRAMIAGYEVLGRIGRALDPKIHYGKGFHPTGTCGPYGAAMAAAFLLGFTEEQAVNALAIASIGSAGLLEFLADGSLTKRLHPGWAAHTGLTAAFLARAGYTGPRTVFEGAKGFLRAYSNRPDPALAGGPWDPLGRELMNTAIKPHACCRYNQSAIDGVLELVGTYDLRPEDIASIRIGVLSVAWDIVAEPLAEKRNPGSVVDAQFSLPFAAAVAALRQRASPAEYSPEIIGDPSVK